MTEVSLLSDAWEWLTQFFNVLTRYSDKRMLSYIRQWYRACQSRFGTNGSYTGPGDILGAMGPLEIFAAFFLLLAVLLLIFSRKQKKGGARLAGFAAFLAFMCDVCWGIFWLKPGQAFFIRASWIMMLIMAALVALVCISLYSRARKHIRQVTVPKQAPAKPSETQAPEQLKALDDNTAQTAQVQKEITELEKQLEEVKRRKEALSK